jgi:hypothetical protein
MKDKPRSLKHANNKEQLEELLEPPPKRVRGKQRHAEKLQMLFPKKSVGPLMP